MNKNLEFKPSDETDVVTRVLLSVHHAIDLHFPNAATAPKRFSKTAFSDQLADTGLNTPMVPGIHRATENDDRSQAVTREKSLQHNGYESSTPKTPEWNETIGDDNPHGDIPVSTSTPPSTDPSSSPPQSNPVYSESNLSKLDLDYGFEDGRSIWFKLLVLASIVIILILASWSWIEKFLQAYISHIP